MSRRPARRRPFIKLALAAVPFALFAGPVAAQVDVSLPVDEADERPALALMGTIPIYWGEVDGMADIFAGAGETHWARAELEREYRLVPLDYLSADALAHHRFLLMAQPRGLTAEENVALDAWVRGGGNLLLFADPMMTGHSRFGIGDRRRPQDTILLSPILTYWGLELHFDDAQPDGLGERDFRGGKLPVNLPGQFNLLDGAQDRCTLESGGVVAWCALGDGQVTVVADGAMLDIEETPASATDALWRLLAWAMGNVREMDTTPGY